MNGLTRQEELRIWMKRNGLTQEYVSSKLDITRQTFILRMRDYSFNPHEVNILKAMGAEV